MTIADRDELFFLLQNQLKKAGISEEDIKPEKLANWSKLINRINQAYLDYDQERYLLERMMDKSSAEMRSLNDRLMEAQAVARFGYWMFDMDEIKFVWAAGLEEILGFNLIELNGRLEDIMDYIDPEDINEMKNFVTEIENDELEHEVEIKAAKNNGDKKKYFFIKGRRRIVDKHNMASGIVVDISKNKKSEDDRKKMQNKLLSISRQSGMSEIATVVLHNVGNILNSANVSIDYVLSKINDSHVSRLIEIAEIINAHLQNNKDDYLFNDKKGKLYPKYLLELSKSISEEYSAIRRENIKISRLLEHIKQIVSMQNEISGIGGVCENVKVSDLVDMSIQISGCDLENNYFKLIKDYQDDAVIYAEKSRMLQVLVNLIKNAKDSIYLVDTPDSKFIKVSIKKDKAEPAIAVIIEDNGVGIEKNDLSKIFNLGYTTKVEGHGFGLHSSAITAKELKSSISVHSDGLNKGAIFKLSIQLPD